MLQILILFQFGLPKNGQFGALNLGLQPWPFPKTVWHEINCNLENVKFLFDKLCAAVQNGEEKIARLFSSGERQELSLLRSNLFLYRGFFLSICGTICVICTKRNRKILPSLFSFPFFRQKNWKKNTFVKMKRFFLTFNKWNICSISLIVDFCT